jgi:hypothetical protein
MRPAQAALADIIKGGSFQRELVADVYLGSDRILENIPLEDWSLKGDVDGAIKTSASATVVYTDDFAGSYTPRELTDAFAPFGQELRTYMKISAGNAFNDRIPMGVYRIDEVPSATDAQIQFRERVLTVGSRIELSLMDRFLTVSRARFRSLEQPQSLTSTWAEIARVSRLPITRTMPDQPIPTSVTYSRSRLDTVQLLASILGGRATMLSDGTLGVIPDTPPAASTRLEIGEDGVVLDVDYSVTSDRVYNVVVGDFEDELGRPIHVEAQVDSGPLAFDGPYGEYVTEFPSDRGSLISTTTAAVSAVQAHLAEVSATDRYELPLQAILDPRLELGDVVEVERLDRVLTGRINAYTFGRTGPMSLTLGVISDVPL